MKALALVRASLWLVGFAFLIGGSRLQAAEGWVERYVGADTLDDVTYGAGLFAGVGGAVYTSPDGVWWTRHALDPAPINGLGGHTYRLQVSLALPATSWTDVLTITLQLGYPGPPVELLDPNATSGGQRFYRAISP